MPPAEATPPVSPFAQLFGVLNSPDAPSVVSDDPAAPTPAGRKKATARTKAQQEAAEAAEAVELSVKLVNTGIKVLDLGVQTVVGPEAAMGMEEWMLMRGPLIEFCANSDKVAKAAGVFNPIAVIAAFSFWGYRIAGVWRAKHPDWQPPNLGKRKPKHEPVQYPSGPMYTPDVNGNGYNAERLDDIISADKREPVYINDALRRMQAAIDEDVDTSR